MKEETGITTSFWIFPSQISFIEKRSNSLKYGSASEYIRALIEKDRDNMVNWENNNQFEKDQILKGIYLILERLGIEKTELTEEQKHELEEIGKDVSINDAIKLMTKEGIL